MTATPLLTTKLHAPRRREGLVARPRLTEALNRGLDAALTLVSAPAGFGKSTALTQWLASLTGTRAVAWLSLDERDNDPTLFWSYVVAALRTVVPDAGATVPSAAGAPTETDLIALINDLSAAPDDVVLVLDDIHVIESRDVHTGLAFLLDHLPDRIHLVLAGRSDPPLPLARLRGRGELVEVRAADLRFSLAEAAEYLTGSMELALSEADVATLDGRTEGWIAALQLAALSMRGRSDGVELAGFIADFAGDDRYIVDYLIEEVLDRQPPLVRDFLLETSILDRMDAALADAVTGHVDGRSMLELLDRGNLFLIPLDDRRRWYRYHQLFADVLRAHLHDERPGVVAELHRRAAQWYEANGDRAGAVEHALAGGDVGRAAALIELSLPALQRNRQEATMRRWLQALPDDVVRGRPVLSVGYAASSMIHGEIDGVERRLRDAERWLGAAPGDRAGMVVVDEEAFGQLPSAIELYRAGQAHVRGDVAATMTHAHAAFDLAGPGNDIGRGSAAGLLGLAHWRDADLDTAYRWWARCAAELERAGHLADITGCALAMADIRIAQGRLDEAVDAYRRAMRLVCPDGGPALRGAADLHVGLAGVLVERGDLPAARRHLTAAAELGERLGLPQNPYRSRVVRARLRLAESDPDGAIVRFDEAERVYNPDMFPDVRPVSAERARIWTRHGRSASTLAWARERGLSVDDHPEYLREFEHLTLARALVTADRAKDTAAAEALLERVRGAAEDGGRVGAVIAALVATALARQARGDRPAAGAALREALRLAEPSGHVRIFLDEGPPLLGLLNSVAGQDESGYAGRLLASAASADRPAEELIDPLSARELDVLRLLGTDLDGPEIARTLFVSVNTVRTHTKNIYAKLGVNNRRAAVRRAADLGLR